MICIIGYLVDVFFVKFVVDEYVVGVVGVVERKVLVVVCFIFVGVIIGMVVDDDVVFVFC